MREITIGNLRNKPGKGHRCDRASYLGNPFDLKSEKLRDYVCDGFQEYFDLVLGGAEPAIAMLDIAHKYDLYIAKSWHPPTRDQFLRELSRIEEIAKTEPCTLLCWCSPKRCHVETISNYLRHCGD